MFDFSEKIVLITGAAGNLGQAVAEAFSASGANLILVDHRLERLHEIFAGWVEHEEVWMYGTDLTSAEEVEKLRKQVIADAGRVDVLVNVAGGFTMGEPVHESELKTWEFMLDLNAKSVFLMGRAFAPQMIERGEGKIVNIGARAALQGSAKMAPYIVSKSAVIRLTESMAAELKGEGINVNCILPGTIDTPQNRKSMPNANFDKWVPPTQLASVILFLCSEAAAAVHGAAVPVYGLS